MKLFRLRPLLFCLLALPAFAGEDNEQAVALTTRAGSRLYGLLSAAQPFTFRGTDGGGRIDWSTVAHIHIGERVNPNSENEARNALGDLLSDKYEIRQKALRQLRELGRAALRPLREALASADPELGRSARALLAELGELGSTGASGDLLHLKDGTQRRGEFLPGSIRFRTRWGYWTVPVDAVDSLEPVNAERIAAAELVSPESLPAPFSQRKSDGAPAIQPWHPAEGGPAAHPRDAYRSMTMVNFDSVLLANPDGSSRLAPVKADDNLAKAYANRGLLLRTSGEGRVPAAAELNLNSLSGNFGLQLDGGAALWVDIIQPTGPVPKADVQPEPAGAHIAGAFVGTAEARSIGLAAYDKSGRLLGVVYNEGVTLPEGVGAVDGIAELLAVRSSVPVSRLRFFRVGDGKEKTPLRVDDVFVDWIVSADRSPDLFGITLRSGERLCGTLKDADWQKGLTLQAEFLPPEAAALRLSCDDIVVFDTPARRSEPPADKKRQRLVIGNQHAVLLQNGEKFHACFVKLDDKEALFLMSGEVEFRLPRTLLRKVDLQPAFDQQTGRATTEIAATEKPGVEFRKRERKGLKPGVVGAPDGKAEDAGEKEEKKNDLLQQQQELKRMDDAKIVSADLISGDLTVDDGGGDWTIGLAPVKALVFPPDAEAAAQQPGFREWQIVLRDRSRFDVVPLALSNESLTVQIARGVVQMPFSVFESLQRRK